MLLGQSEDCEGSDAHPSGAKHHLHLWLGVVGPQGTGHPCHVATSLSSVRPLVDTVVGQVPSQGSCWESSANPGSDWVSHCLS